MLKMMTVSGKPSRLEHIGPKNSSLPSEHKGASVGECFYRIALFPDERMWFDRKGTEIWSICRIYGVRLERGTHSRR